MKHNDELFSNIYNKGSYIYCMNTKVETQGKYLFLFLGFKSWKSCKCYESRASKIEKSQ